MNFKNSLVKFTSFLFIFSSIELIGAASQVTIAPPSPPGLPPQPPVFVSPPRVSSALQKMLDYNSMQPFPWNEIVKNKAFCKLLAPELLLDLNQESIDFENELNVNKQIIDSLTPYKNGKPLPRFSSDLAYIEAVIGALNRRNAILQNIIEEENRFLEDGENTRIYFILQKYNFKFQSNGVKKFLLRTSKGIKSGEAYFQPTEEEFRLLESKIAFPGMNEALKELRDKLARTQQFEQLYKSIASYQFASKPKAFGKESKTNLNEILSSLRDTEGTIKKIQQNIANCQLFRGLDKKIRDILKLLMEDCAASEQLIVSSIAITKRKLAEQQELNERSGPNLLRESYLHGVGTPEEMVADSRFFDIPLAKKEVTFNQGTKKLMTHVHVVVQEETPILKLSAQPEIVQDDVLFIMNIVHGILYILPFESIEGFHHHHIYLAGSIDTAGIVQFKDGKIKHIAADTGHYKSSVTAHFYPALAQLPSEWFCADAIVSNYFSNDAPGYKQMSYIDFMNTGHENYEFWNEPQWTVSGLENYHRINKQQLRKPLAVLAAAN